MSKTTKRIVFAWSQLLKQKVQMSEEIKDYIWLKKDKERGWS